MAARDSLTALPDLTVKDVPQPALAQPADNHPLLVVELPGGKIIGDTVLVATGDDAVVGAVQGLAGCAVPEEHWLLQRRRLRIPRRVRGTALLLGANADNYFHWCFDTLPRWRLLQDAGWDASRADWVVLGHAPLPFQKEMLEVLGVSAAKTLRCSKNTILQFDRLVVPSMPVSVSGTTSPWVRHFLRRTFLSSTAPAAKESVYVSRRQIRRRRLANEAEVEDRLRQLGFRICALEQMAVGDQIQLFASARLIVAPHGAGLANLVFSSPGGRLIELFHPEHPNGCYQDLALAMGLTYEAIVGVSTSKGPTTDDRKAEFKVNIGEVARAITEV
jgi:capsular polysaccharide biosynthesis protein